MENKISKTGENKTVRTTAKKTPVSKPVAANEVVVAQPEEEYDEIVYVKKAMVGGIIGVVAGSTTLILAQIFACATIVNLIAWGLSTAAPIFLGFMFLLPNVLTFAFSLVTIINGRFRKTAASFAVVSCATSVLLIFVWPPRLILFVLFLLSSIFLFINK